MFSPLPGAITPAPSSGGGGGMTLIDEITVDSGTQDTMEIDIPSFSEGDIYKLEAYVNFGSLSSLFITIDSDTAQTGYTRTTFAGGQSGNSSILTGSLPENSGRYVKAEFTWYENGWQFISSGTILASTAPTNTVYKYTETAPTKITLRGTASSTFKAGSMFKIYKLTP